MQFNQKRCRPFSSWVGLAGRGGSSNLLRFGVGRGEGEGLEKGEGLIEGISDGKGEERGRRT
jgi:hypothetical protein